ncbi:ABC transporter ATP-binding protein [Paenibacillus sp. LPE1-1-1.1]|uniref:ABC transporter ATP-binding protein n=1 Tax=Paenibacillus sp. LPE1-1-1.1 TaxID=3135230 RepID=UPI0034448974
MLSDYAIEIKNVTKTYTVYNKPIDRLYDLILNGSNRGRQINALDSVNMNIPKGKTIGLIGQNGSGKSTLLQIIAGTLKPTYGNVHVGGKIAALLELGSGFNPEFSGRENVVLNGTLMGLSRDDINQRMDSIIDFADIGDFIEQPVKTYSSGMFLRLAFAAAVHTDPDILIVDEALAVGDARFQNKCFRKFKEFQEAGKTILFVSHTTELLVRHCDYAYLLNKGKMIFEGAPKDVVNEYHDQLFGKTEMVPVNTTSVSKKNAHERENEEDTFITIRPNDDNCIKNLTYNPQEYRWGNRDAEIVDYQIESDGRYNQMEYNTAFPMSISLKVKFNKTILRPVYGLTIKTTDGVIVYGSNSRDQGQPFIIKNQDDWSIVKFEFLPNLVQADYFISLGVAEDIPGEEPIPLDRRYDMIHVKLSHNTLGFGIVDLNMNVTELR